MSHLETMGNDAVGYVTSAELEGARFAIQSHTECLEIEEQPMEVTPHVGSKVHNEGESANISMTKVTYSAGRQGSRLIFTTSSTQRKINTLSF